MMSRKQFIESHGATGKNWNWIWFFNVKKKLVVFGAWDMYDDGIQAVILNDEWENGSSGKHNPGYSQAIEHVRLVEDEGYQLKTFPMQA